MGQGAWPEGWSGSWLHPQPPESGHSSRREAFTAAFLLPGHSLFLTVDAQALGQVSKACFMRSCVFFLENGCLLHSASWCDVGSQEVATSPH